MKNPTTPQTRTHHQSGPCSLVFTAVAAATVLAVAGCGSKPPGCADEATAGVIKSILADNAKDALGFKIEDDTRKIADGYLQGLKVSLKNVVSDGYDDRAKKNSCRAKLVVNTPAGAEFSRDTQYTTQKTEDKSGGFLVEVEGAQAFINSIAGDLRPYYARKRYVGEWQGTYSCQGIAGASDGPQGPYSMPVALVVDNDLNAKLERTTKGGGIETLAAQLGLDFVFGGRTLQLKGEGKNNPDDTWRAVFDGKVQGMDFTATGKLLNENQLLRTCSLKLTLPSN